MQAVGSKGFEGPASIIRLIIDLQVKPSKLTKPDANAVNNLSTLIFSWKNSQPATLSRVEIATDINFEKIIKTTPYTDQSQISLNTPISPGKYFWRVRSIIGGNQSSVSNSRSVTLKKPLKAPAILATLYDKKTVKLLWLPDEKAKGYQVQIALDPKFKNIIKEKHVEYSHASIELDRGKTYYARVKALGSDFWLSTIGNFKQLSIQ
jgi:hypothetical protein